MCYSLGTCTVRVVTSIHFNGYLHKFEAIFIFIIYQTKKNVRIFGQFLGGTTLRIFTLKKIKVWKYSFYLDIFKIVL